MFELQIAIGQKFLRCPVLEDPMRSERFEDVRNGCALQWDNLCPFGEAIGHE